MADIEYLMTLQAVRDRANLVQKAAEQGELTHFNYNVARMPAVADFVAGVIAVCSPCSRKSGSSRRSGWLTGTARLWSRQVR